MKKTALSMMLLTIVIKLFGFLKGIVLSYYYGASNISDIYIVGTTLPTVIFAFVGVSITTIYIPMYQNIRQEEDFEVANLFTSNISNVFLIVISIVVLLINLFSEYIVKVFASGFTGETLSKTSDFVDITSFSLYFLLIIHIFQGYLNANKSFLLPLVAQIPLNIIVMASIAFSYDHGIKVIPYSYLFAFFIQSLILLIYSHKQGYKHTFYIDIKNKYIKQALYLSIPVIIGISVSELNVVVDKTLASQISIGGISALQYANKLSQFIQGIFITSMVTLIYPSLSKLNSLGKYDEASKMVKKTMVSIAVVIIPITFGTIIFSKPITSLLYGRGAFDVKSLSMTASALAFYSLGMIGIGLRELFSRLYYSMGDTKTPMKNSAYAMVLNIVLNLIFSKFLGIGGLALATSISSIFAAVLMIISLKKRKGSFDLNGVTKSFLKILKASFAMGIIAKSSFNYLTSILSQNLSLVIAIIVGVISYFIVINHLKIDDVDLISKMIRKKIGRKKN